MRLWIDSIEHLQCSEEKEMVSFHHREAGGSHTLHQFYAKEVGVGREVGVGGREWSCVEGVCVEGRWLVCGEGSYGKGVCGEGGWCGR